MADKNDGADKSELPTPKRLKDARKKGDIAKSKDLGVGLLTAIWLGIFAFVSGFVAIEIAQLFSDVIATATTMPFEAAAPTIGMDALTTLMKISLMTLVPVAVMATFAEFVQVGPLFTTEKMKFNLEKLNPMDGFKRMFGKDGLVELFKTLIKVGFVCAISYVVMRTAVAESGQIVRMASWSPVADTGPAAASATLDLTYRLTIKLFALVVAVFLIVAAADWIYSKYSFIKKMKMSRRDIKQEYKDDEGDPMVKAERRGMHQEWANQGSMAATRNSSALLVNPTHIAIALDYDEEKTPVPVIAAKGAGELAAAMRAEATAHGIPIVRNVATARTLWARGEVGEIVPEDMFDAIAAIILWSKKARDGKAPMDHDMDVKQTPLARFAATAS